MSYYRFPNNTTLGGKYVSNWTAGYNPQKYRWKRWSNATGYDMFIPENTSSERSTVHSYLQNVSGVSRTVGLFGAADGRTIVTSTPVTGTGTCWSGTNPTDPGAAAACPGGTTDRFGSLWRVNTEALSESNDNPYYNTAGDARGNTESWYLSFRYNNSGGGSENVYDYYISWCASPAFPYRSYQVRQCYITADRGRCWEQCGNNIPSVVETLVIAGGGGGGGSYRNYWEGGEKTVPIYDYNAQGQLIIVGYEQQYVQPYDFSSIGGGGGAGGYRTGNVFIEASNTVSITIGAGGAGGYGTSSGANGSNTRLVAANATIHSHGGGFGGGGYSAGGNGGSGGGGGANYQYNLGEPYTTANFIGGTANTTVVQGFSGSNATEGQSGAGGGASEKGGTDGIGQGGDGLSSSISGSAVTRGGGGGGGGSYRNYWEGGEKTVPIYDYNAQGQHFHIVLIK